jgi:hypothetical protein
MNYNSIWGYVVGAALAVKGFIELNPDLFPHEAEWYKWFQAVASFIAAGAVSQAFRRSLDNKDVKASSLKAPDDDPSPLK